MPERRATLVKGYTEVLWLLIPNELLQHILKAEYRLSRQATRCGQLLPNGKKGAIHIRRPIDKVHHRPLSHSLTLYLMPALWPLIVLCYLKISAAAHLPVPDWPCPAWLSWSDPPRTQ